ncbi:uncharacterized protein LOC119657696 isoform X2 [Hermetia illucens]|uniref:uncharacterized protein LOC119657696 isoform X2 n=1 Tax=Hermetia illucens TaxID=343691 RepID=UPI0018CC0CA3|nr:uncharacterized protein LOC119657696 isoform X2 [Hermetia illucens]
MLLANISPFVSIDKIIVKDSKKYVHFITHLDQCLTVPNDWESFIYTSRYIAQLLSLKRTPIPMKFFRTLKVNELQVITLPDGTAIRVRMFASKELRGNVMFHFESSSHFKAIYSGPFIECRSLFLDQYFRNCVLSQIDELYVDNTRAYCTHNESFRDIGDSITKIFEKHPGCVIMMNVAAFGYEDLIYLLAKEYGFKIFVGSLIFAFKKHKVDKLFTTRIEDANIVIGERSVTLKNLQSRFAQNRITVHFVESNFELKNNFTNLGLYLLHWTPHPSLFEMYTLISFVKPYNVYGIYPDMPQLPKSLICLCRRKASMGSNENNNQTTATEKSNCSMLPVNDLNAKGGTEIIRGATNTQEEKNSMTPPVAVIKPIGMGSLPTNERREENNELDVQTDIFDKELSSLSLSLTSSDENSSSTEISESETHDESRRKNNEDGKQVKPVHYSQKDHPIPSLERKQPATKSNPKVDKTVDIISDESEENVAMLLPLSGASSRRAIELPRNVVSMRARKMNDDLTPRIAIIKPFILKEEMIVENEQRESTDNVGTDIFDKELSSLSISDDAEDIFSSGSDETDIFKINVSAQGNCAADEVVNINAYNPTQAVSPKPVQRGKRKYPDSAMKSVPLNSGKFIESKYKTKSFSKKKPLIRYSDDSSD